MQTEREPVPPPKASRLIIGIVLAGVLVLVAVVRFGRGPEAPAPGAAGLEPAAAPAPLAADPPGPGFDLVRVERDGDAVVAGTADAGATVTVLADEQPIAEVTADAEGNFVAVFTATPGTEPRTLSLQAVTPDGTASRSEDVVMLLPTPGAPPAAAPAAGANVASGPPPEAAADGAAAPVPGAVTAAAPVPGAVTPEARPAGPAGTDAAGPRPRLAATVVVRRSGIEVMPADAGPGGQVALASISYGDEGGVTLEGMGSPGARVRAYVDDGLAQEGTIGADGRWALPLDAVSQGVYRLRIDALDAAGRVASRIETPFQRDFPRLPPPRPGEPRDGVVTVQPGNNLWTIARTHLGSGVRYSQIFTANRELIRDPDLIYPGQILNLPDDQTGE